MKMNKLILKAVATGIITLTILAQITPNPTYANTQPTDISGHWSESFVTSLVNQGVISGYPDGTFKPDKAISSSEFLSLILKAIGETPSAAQSGEAWDAPIIKLAIEKGIIKSDDTFALTNQELTREETAYILYNTLSQKESFKYDQCYTPILDQAIFDHGTISAKYRDAVYSMLQKGVLTGNQNYFYPSQTFNRGGACVVIERVMDAEKRSYSDKVKNGVMTHVFIKEPIESKTAVQMSFENGKPVIDKEKVLSELKQYTNNINSGSLDDWYTYDEYVNLHWYGAGYDTLEAKVNEVDSLYNMAIKGVNLFYNYDYQMNLTAYEKELRRITYGSSGSDGVIRSQIEDIKKYTLSVESYFVTDKSLFYHGSDMANRTRGRLYFIFKSPSQKAYMEQTHYRTAMVNLKVDQWYYIDFEALSGSSGRTGDFDWNQYPLSYYVNYYLSDFIPVKPIE